eukprot:TRINITY_DN25634_c0_g1_i1.p2 TRINITY_DN25634_c0_g1~~TRINITY_DN25634_c0_g1_i1.p2  ORF type:complete len:195 (+),score=89.45 TRINITY_DN25634_c0_g1_i1:386-970(+)
MAIKDVNIHLAAMDGDAVAIQRWLDEGLFVDKRDNFERTPLHQAAWSGRVEAMKLLLGAYAQINARDRDQCTPLHYAASTNQVAVAQELLRRKADANVKDIKHETPLFKAAMLGNADVVEHLLASGADVTIPDAHGHLPGGEFNTKVDGAARERITAALTKVQEERAAARAKTKASELAELQQRKKRRGCCAVM